MAATAAGGGAAAVASSELVSLGEVTPNNVGQLRKLNAVIFPVPYSDRFYACVLEVPALARLGTPARRGARDGHERARARAC